MNDRGGPRMPQEPSEDDRYEAEEAALLQEMFVQAQAERTQLLGEYFDLNPETTSRYISDFSEELSQAESDIAPVVPYIRDVLRNEERQTGIPSGVSESIQAVGMPLTEAGSRRWHRARYRDEVAAVRAETILCTHWEGGRTVEDLKRAIVQDFASSFIGPHMEAPPQELRGIVDERNAAGEYEKMVAELEKNQQAFRDSLVENFVSRGVPKGWAAQQADQLTPDFKARVGQIRTIARLRIRRALSHYSIDELTNLVLGLKEGKMPV